MVVFCDKVTPAGLKAEMVKALAVPVPVTCAVVPLYTNEPLALYVLVVV
jgi:hypothetical protein